MNEIKKYEVLKTLRLHYKLEYVKYDVISKTFLYKFPNGEKKSITFDTLLNIINDDLRIYTLLNELRDSYFPRRLKEVIISFYNYHNLEVPYDLFISENGFEIIINDEINYVRYDDYFDNFLSEFSKCYSVENKQFIIEPKPKDFVGEYHK